MSRKPIPDIMGSLMNGNTSTLEAPSLNQNTANGKTIKQPNLMGIKEESKLFEEKQESNQAIKLQKNNCFEQYGNKETLEDQKEKATFNLSLSALEKLEDAWIQLRRKLKGEQRVTKTLIVEKAIEMALNDLKVNGEKGELYRRLIES